MTTEALAPPASTEAAPSSTTGLATRFARRLFEPVDIGMVAFFRIAFGALLAFEAYRYLSLGWVHQNYVDPDFFFPFFGFSWVKPWPGNGMIYAFWAMAFLGVCISVGFCYRVATALFFLNFAHIFLVDQSYYLNHFYLITIVSFLLFFIPANRAWSVDAWLQPSLRSDTVPTWTLWLLRFQVGVAYFYGGIAKMNSDWFHGEPMRMTLAEHTDFPLIGQWFTEEWMVWGFTWGGLLFDLLVVPALLWPKTRWLGWCASLLFNLTNSILFEIGIFPWFMVAATMIFFPPDWLRAGTEAAEEKTGRGAPRRAADRQLRTTGSWSPMAALTSRQRITVGLLAAWVTFQVLMPFRHFLYPGDVSWTEEGHHFAWHMKLRRKHGDVAFTAVTEDGRRLGERDLVRHASPELKERMNGRFDQLTKAEQRGTSADRLLYISPRQRKKMSGRPEMILQYAHFLAKEFERAGYGRVAIYCDSAIGLNGRETQPIVDASVNLADITSSLKPASWIVPLTTPLPTPTDRRTTIAGGDSD